MSAATIEREERRIARDAFRACGGSKRRPLHSFKTQAEKKAIRLEHAERINEAVAALREPEGFADWLTALSLNASVSPLNAALIAFQCPDQIAETAASWKRAGFLIRKGESAAGWITGPLFWPRAVFTPAQVQASELIDVEPEPLPRCDLAGSAQAELCERLDTGEKSRDVLADLSARLRGEAQ